MRLVLIISVIVQTNDLKENGEFSFLLKLIVRYFFLSVVDKMIKIIAFHLLATRWQNSPMTSLKRASFRNVTMANTVGNGCSLNEPIAGVHWSI